MSTAGLNWAFGLCKLFGLKGDRLGDFARSAVCRHRTQVDTPLSLHFCTRRLPAVVRRPNRSFALPMVLRIVFRSGCSRICITLALPAVTLTPSPGVPPASKNALRLAFGTPEIANAARS